MGTNWYLHCTKRILEQECPTCGQNWNKPIHIGKSSKGNAFLLHRIKEHGLVDFETWVKFIIRACHIDGAYISTDNYVDKGDPDKLLEWPIVVRRIACSGYRMTDGEFS